MKSKLLILCVVLSMTGCTSLQMKSGKTEETAIMAGLEQERLALTRDMRDELLGLVQSIEYSNRVLGEVKNGESALKLTAEDMAQIEWNASEVPAGMGIPMSLDQTNHPEKVIELIAQLTGYTYVPIGEPSPLVHPVTVSGYSTAHQYLRSIGIQLGSSVKITPIPTNRTIEVNWRYGRSLQGGEQ